MTNELESIAIQCRVLLTFDVQLHSLPGSANSIGCLTSDECAVVPSGQQTQGDGLDVPPHLYRLPPAVPLVRHRRGVGLHVTRDHRLVTFVKFFCRLGREGNMYMSIGHVFGCLIVLWKTIFLLLEYRLIELLHVKTLSYIIYFYVCVIINFHVWLL